MPTKPVGPSAKSLLKKWVSALRSGKYKQCESTLYDGKGYCCLGVLGEVLAPVGLSSLKVTKGPRAYKDEGVWYDPQDPTRDKMTLRYRGKESDSMLPMPLVTRLGITEKVQEHLIDMNDHHGKGFKAIANYIEKNVIPKVKA